MHMPAANSLWCVYRRLHGGQVVKWVTHANTHIGQKQGWLRMCHHKFKVIQEFVKA